MDKVHLAIEIIGAIVACASALANVVPPDSLVGKILHYAALNGPKIQSAVSALGEK